VSGTSRRHIPCILDNEVQDTELQMYLGIYSAMFVMEALEFL
jgi:hypothetical protein